MSQGPYDLTQIGQFSGRTLPIMSIPNTSQYTTNMSAIRPSVSFLGMTRYQAQEKLSQVPKSIFNPLTDQRADVTGVEMPDM